MSHIESAAASVPNSPPASTAPTETAAPPASKGVRRERLIVRGVIGILLVVLAVEAIAFARLNRLHQQLWSELQTGEREGVAITRARIDAVAGRPPDAEYVVKAPVGEERYDMYAFWGLLKTRELYVHYGVSGIGAEPEVVNVLTATPEEVLSK